jgi:RNA polymerase sigma factor (TIGR02999 family)
LRSSLVSSKRQSSGRLSSPAKAETEVENHNAAIAALCFGNPTRVRVAGCIIGTIPRNASGANDRTPTASSKGEVTGLLLAWREGDQGALDRLVPLIYSELRRLAHGYMRGERPGHSLQTTALIHEAYVRLVDAPQMRWQNHAHFLAVSAQVMRRILVDVARSERSLKRGGDRPHVSFDEGLAIPQEARPDLAALDDALIELAAMDPRKSRVVELRFFGGLTAEQTAEVLGVSGETVLRDWKLAKAWLLGRLETA